MIIGRSQTVFATLAVGAAILRSSAFTFAAESVGPARTDAYSVTERLDMAMVKRNDSFGYTDEEIRKYFDYPQVFNYDATGIAADRIKRHRRRSASTGVVPGG